MEKTRSYLIYVVILAVLIGAFSLPILIMRVTNPIREGPELVIPITGGSVTPTASPLPTLTTTDTATPTGTSTASATPSYTASSTITHTATPTATPSRTLIPFTLTRTPREERPRPPAAPTDPPPQPTNPPGPTIIPPIILTLLP